MRILLAGGTRLSPGRRIPEMYKYIMIMISVEETTTIIITNLKIIL